MNFRKMSDEDLGIWQQAAAFYAFWGTPGGHRLAAEIGRRAEIRMERGEFGGSHPASWYDPRPIVNDMDEDSHSEWE
jgi:hypothetical protein